MENFCSSFDVDSFGSLGSLTSEQVRNVARLERLALSLLSIELAANFFVVSVT